MTRLTLAYETKGLPLDDRITDAEADDILNTYMEMFLGTDDKVEESSNYLRKLGALDETNSQSPQVMIPNYISSPTNCVAASPASFYSVCCLNECEGLMAHLEHGIAASETSSEQIVQLVSNLSSDTVDAPRNLSFALLNRLNEIASEHSGMVPLHGRLFAQWMHHAYPRECPFPHIAGTTSPVSPDEWMQETGESCFATDEEIQHYSVTEPQQPVLPEKESKRLICLRDVVDMQM